MVAYSDWVMNPMSSTTTTTKGGYLYYYRIDGVCWCLVELEVVFVEGWFIICFVCGGWRAGHALDRDFVFWSHSESESESAGSHSRHHTPNLLSFLSSTTVIILIYSGMDTSYQNSQIWKSINFNPRLGEYELWTVSFRRWGPIDSNTSVTGKMD